MNDEKTKQQGMNIEIPVEVASGVYSNLAVITHSPTEFIADFVQAMPGVPKPVVKSRVILTPQHAKRLLMALSDNIDKYEATFCRIKDEMPKNIPFDISNPAEA